MYCTLQAKTYLFSFTVKFYFQFYTDAMFKAPHKKQLQLLAKSDIVVYAYQFEQGGVDLYGKDFNISGKFNNITALVEI